MEQNRVRGEHDRRLVCTIVGLDAGSQRTHLWILMIFIVCAARLLWGNE